MDYVVFCVIITSHDNYRSFDTGYLVTAPNQFIPGRDETVCIELYNTFRGRTTVKIELDEVWIGYSWRPVPPGAKNGTVDSATVYLTYRGNKVHTVETVTFHIGVK